MNSVVTQRFIKCHDKLKQDNQIKSSRQFAMSLDYLPQSLSEILRGRRDVTVELIRKAVLLYKMNPVYLYTGEGLMFLSEAESRDVRVLTVLSTPQAEERIIHVPLTAQPAYADECSNPAFVERLPSYSLADYKYRVGTFRSFDVGDDHMHPSLVEGDKVIASYIEPGLWETAIQNNHVFVIVKAGQVVMRRVLNRLLSDKVLELRSDNEGFSPELVAPGTIREIWHIHARLSPFLHSPDSWQKQLSEELRETRQALLNQSKLIHALHEALEKKVNTPS
ncbi:MAG: S24 family peptidase [Saprospiraceae bacterium]|jgi:hypothetical protein|nr:S24 family peptidase [Saprospiraceae bacterium]